MPYQVDTHIDRKLNIARLFSRAEFLKAEKYLSEQVEFHIYEDDKHLIGKNSVLRFCQEIAQYCSGLETCLEESGHA